MKAMTRQQLAYFAGVSTKTLQRWCKPHRQELEALGMRPNMSVLPPRIVQWICEQFCIDVE
jgi:hypothetical protein